MNIYDQSIRILFIDIITITISTNYTIVSYGVTFITEPHPLSEDRKCDCHIIEYNDNERW